MHGPTLAAFDSSARCRAGDRWNVAGDLVICKVPGSETDNAFCIVEIHSPPGGGPPAHVHRCEDEVFQIIEGEFEFTAGERTVRLGQGEVAVGMRGIPHCYRNVGPAMGRLLVTLIPAGFEEFFREANALSRRGSKDDASLADLGRQYELEFLKPAGSC